MARAQRTCTTVCHYTPATLARACRYVLGGGIDLDPASDPFGQRSVGARRYFAEEDDGLSLRWQAPRVFCNPPGGKRRGRSHAALWWHHATLQWRQRWCDHVLFLAFSLNLFQTALGESDLHPLDFHVAIPRIRVPYARPDLGEDRSQPSHPSAVILLSESPAAHARLAATFGPQGGRFRGRVQCPARLPRRWGASDGAQLSLLTEAGA